MKTSAPLCEYVIIVGGPCTGKTLNKPTLMHHYGCQAAYDCPGEEAQIRSSTANRILILTDNPDLLDPRHPFPRRKPRMEGIRIPIRLAAAALGERWINPNPARLRK